MKEKLIAILICSLIIALPLYSSSVYAGLTELRVEGIDGVDGYIRSEDFIKITVTASIDEDSDITNEQVRLKKVRSFDSCGEGTSGTDCSIRIPREGTRRFAGTKPFTVELFYDGGVRKAGTINGEVTVDNKAPVIRSFSITPPVTNSGEVVFKYEVEDYAFISGDTSKCSGIKEIKFYENDLTGTVLDKVELDTDECSITGSRDFPSSALGEVTVCAKAYDWVGHESSINCKTFTVDKEAPVVDADSLIIVDSRGNEISHFADSPINVIMSVNIAGDDLDESSVSADISSLNPGQSGYQGLPGSCGSTTEGITTCTWNFDLKPGEGGAKNIVITAKDGVDNGEAQTVSRTFTYDNAGPVITSLRTDRVDNDGNYYASTQGTRFIAEITDAAGVDKSDILLHIGRLVFSADNCTPTSSGWSCYWDRNVGGSGTVTASIGTDSKDILGNSVGSQERIDVIIDNTRPNVVDVTINVIGGSAAAFEGHPVKGNSLEITAEVSDIGIAIAYADLSAIIEGADNVTARCDKEDDVVICRWYTESIDISGHINDYLTFYFIDVAGNTASKSEPIEVYGLETDTDPNYWSNSVSCMPKKIDRQVTGLISQRVYCSISLSPSSGSPIVMSINLGDCGDSQEGNSMSFIGNRDIFNNGFKSKNPYIKFTLKKMPMRIDQLDLMCQLKIKSKIGNEITQYDETENVSITIPFYNMPLGEFSDETQKMIDDAKDSKWVKAKWLGTLNKLLGYSTTICGTIQTVKNVGDFIKLLGLLLDATAKEVLITTGWTGIGAGVATAIDTTRMGTQTSAQAMDISTGWTWGKFGNVYCKAMSCRLFYDELWQNEITKTLTGVQKFVLEKADFGTIYNALGTSGYYIDTKGSQTGFETHLTARLNPKDSIILSIATLCLPGVIYNLEKWRQIDCMYVSCLENNARRGLPLSICGEQRSYGKCKYVTGELFQLTPLAILNNFGDLVRRALSSPFGVVDISLAVTCSGLIFTPFTGAMANVCLANKIAGLGIDILEDIEGWIAGDKLKSPPDYCTQMQYENEQESS